MHVLIPSSTILNRQDPAIPVKWLSELFDKYVPDSITEMRRSYSHITPLGEEGGLCATCFVQRGS